jgi:3-phosphoshikimate 1-carboxyvinyltransferase
MARLIARRAPIAGIFRAPAAKPDTQRALIMASLAAGVSQIRDPLLSRETQAMIEACRELGAEITRGEGEIRVRGTGAAWRQGREGHRPATRYIWAAGSALVARISLALGATMPDRLIVDGNCNLRSRPFAPLFTALAGKGVDFAFFDGADRLPAAVLSRQLPGGHYRLATSISSQFVTALMVPGPLATAPTTITLTGPRYSISYIRQTLDLMQRFGIAATMSDDGREIVVPNDRPYAARSIAIYGDYTSASYLLGAAVVTRGRIVVSNLDPASLQGERAIVEIVAALGAKVEWLSTPNTLLVDATALSAPVDAHFDLRDCPNILPTVAAIGATVPGRVRITGAQLTQNHKSPRIEAMATELAKAGVTISVLTKADGTIDGLEIHGREGYRGHVVFSSHGDHRIFMSLALFALSCEQACMFSADDTSDSFPDFLTVLGFGGQTNEGLTDECELVRSAG